MLVISDIHSRTQQLKKLLTNIWDKKETIVFLGDFNDNELGTEDGYSFIEVFKLVKPLFDSNKSVGVHSNHSRRVITYLEGNKCGSAGAFKNTLAELNTLDQKTKDSILTWLKSMPYVLELDNYVFAHAYPSYREHLAINGPYSKADRVQWWLESNNNNYYCRNTDKTVIVGHYGQIVVTKNVIVLDTPKALQQIAWYRTTTSEIGIVNL